MSWWYSNCTHVWIHSVGRGNATFIRTGLNQGFIIDMGKSGEFSPVEFVRTRLVQRLERYNPEEHDENKKCRIAQTLLSHPHSDHISECEELGRGDLYSALVTCPHDKDLQDGSPSYEKLNWRRIKNPDGTDRLLDSYRGLYAARHPPLQTIRFDTKRPTVPNLEYGIYYVRPPVCEDLHETNDNKYGNSTSLLFYLRHGDQTVLLPGDMTPEAMERILNGGLGVEKRYTRFDRVESSRHPNWHIRTEDQPGLRDVLEHRGLSILVAPHHGLESGYSQELYDAMKGGRPELVVISERRHKKPTDGTIHPRYHSETGASGLNVEVEGKNEFRRSLSTVNGHHILIVFAGSGRPKVYADKDPDRLLAKL